MRVVKVVKTYENAIRDLRPKQKEVFEKFRNENLTKYNKQFLLDRLRFHALDVAKLNEYVKLVAEETEKKDLEVRDICQSIVALESRTRSLVPRKTEKESELTPEQKLEQDVFALRLSAAADAETVKILQKVLNMPFTGSNPDQKYLAEAKKNALKVLLRLGAA